MNQTTSPVENNRICNFITLNRIQYGSGIGKSQLLIMAQNARTLFSIFDLMVPRLDTIGAVKVEFFSAIAFFIATGIFGTPAKSAA
ncbi:MAG: hypothetical protein ACK526_03385 [Planctomyces sp.]